MKKKNRLLRDPVYREQASGWLHVIGAAITLFGIFVLAYCTARRDNFPLYWSTAVFMSTMLLVYVFSAVYHIIPHHKEWKQIFRRIDQAMIYFLIAGTYTPICVVALKDNGGMPLIIGIWAIAFTGAILKLANLNLSGTVQTLIYIGLGCAGLLKYDTLLKVFGTDGSWWFFCGGGAYIFGAVVYIIENRIDPQSKGWYHEVFHVFVMIGSFCHFWMMKEYLLRI